MILSAFFGLVSAILLVITWLCFDEHKPRAGVACLSGALLSVVLSFASWGWGGIVLGEGTRVGFVTALSRTGMFYKTWEGSMQVGGFQVDSGGSASARTWEFSVSSDEVARQMTAAMQEGKRVQLRFRDYTCRCQSLGNTDYDVVEVR